MIRPFVIWYTCAVEVLSVYMVYRICHLECHYITITAVCHRFHACGRQGLLNSELAASHLAHTHQSTLPKLYTTGCMGEVCLQVPKEDNVLHKFVALE